MVREATGMDISAMAEIYEEYHLNRCRTRPDLFQPPPEDSFYFNDLSEMLLYGDGEIIVSEDEESGIVNGFCVFAINTPQKVLLRKKPLCTIELLVIRRGYTEKGIDSGIMEFVRNYAAENSCTAVEYSALAESSAVEICENNGFELKTAVMEFRLSK